MTRNTELCTKPNKTECLIFPYERVPFKKYSYFDSIKICSLNISSWSALRIAHSRKFCAKKHNVKLYANMCNVNWHLVGLLFWRSHFIMIRFSSLERDCLREGFKIETQQRYSAAWFTRIAHEILEPKWFKLTTCDCWFSVSRHIKIKIKTVQ